MQNVVDRPFPKRTYIFMPQAYELNFGKFYTKFRKITILTSGSVILFWPPSCRFLHGKVYLISAKKKQNKINITMTNFIIWEGWNLTRTIPVNKSHHKMFWYNVFWLRLVFAKSKVTLIKFNNIGIRICSPSASLVFNNINSKSFGKKRRFRNLNLNLKVQKISF